MFKNIHKAALKTLKIPADTYFYCFTPPPNKNWLIIGGYVKTTAASDFQLHITLAQSQPKITTVNNIISTIIAASLTSATRIPLFPQSTSVSLEYASQWTPIPINSNFSIVGNVAVGEIQIMLLEWDV